MANENFNILVTALGDSFFMDTLGWTKRNLRHVKATGLIPGGWFDAVEKAASVEGLRCPRDVFAWKTPPEPSEHKLNNQEKL